MHLVIRPVSKAEVSAREIRSRLKGSRSDHISVTGASRGDELKGKFGAAVVKWQKDMPVDGAQESDASVSDLPRTEGSGSTTDFSSLSQASAALAKALGASSSSTSSSTDEVSASSSSSSIRGGRRRRNSSTSSATAALPSRFSEVYKRHQKKSHKLSLCIGVFCRSFSLQIQDESMLRGHLSPLMAIHLRDMFFASFPVASKPGSVCAETSFALSVGNVQVDNQRFGVGTYDFPVVFLPQAPTSEAPTSSSQSTFFPEGMSILEIHAIMKSKAFFHTRIVTFDDPMWKQSGIESVDISFKPFSVYVDDTFIYRVLEEVEAFSPSRLTSVREVMPVPPLDHRSPSTGLSRKLPPAMELNSLVLSRPMRVRHLTIQPIKMLLSVHASVRLFLASDHTPLNLAQFQREDVFSTTQRLVHALTVHYASAAIFRAGEWNQECNKSLHSIA